MKSSHAAAFAFATMLVALAGFSQTYFQLQSKGVLAAVHHFHGFMMLTWFILLVTQPMLIRFQKNHWHRYVGRLSYAWVPLVVLSIYLVTRLEYYDDVSKYPTEKVLAGLDFDLTSMFAFVVLYALGIYHRKNTTLHMQYMLSTGLLIMIPGLGRVLEVGLGLKGPMVGIPILLLSFGTCIALIIYERSRRRKFTPYVVTIGLFTVIQLSIMTNRSALWQWLAGSIASIIF